MLSLATHSWTHHAPTRILFGSGTVEQIAGLVNRRKTLLVTSAGFTRRGVTARLTSLLADTKTIVWDRVQPNPDLALLDEALKGLGGAPVECVVALGGGSAMDTAKAFSVGLALNIFLRDHFENKQPLPPGSLLPVITIPTTAGTGSEVTPFGTIWDHRLARKYSIASPHLFPESAILDPDLTINLPADVTLSTGLDALSQGLESVWNRNATPISMGLAVSAAKLALENLPLLMADLANPNLRSKMMSASLLAGLAISQTRTALAHSMSYPITAHFGVPHGLACSFMLPEILEFNAASDDGRLQKLAHQLGESGTVTLIRRLASLMTDLHVKSALDKYIQNPDDVLRHVDEMNTPGRSDNNLRTVTKDEIRLILTKAIARTFET